MKTRIKKRRSFRSEAEERAYWNRTDTTSVLDWSKAAWVTFPNLRPSTRTISVRLPVAMIDALKSLVNQRDVPYQSLLKVFLAERLSREQGQAAARGSSARAGVGRARSLRMSGDEPG